ncbi:hypothetical protein IJI31_03935 [bacterium]|nr:hypothetical protein [bacterium]
MKHIIYAIILMVLFLNLPSYANNTLSKIENSLFGIEYTGQNDSERLARLEKSIYGKTFNDSNLKRTQRIFDDLSADEIGNEIEPKFDTFAEEDEIIELQEKVNYPVIDEIEEKVFKKKFSDKDINTRLASLEKFSFSQTYEKDSFSDRVERLRKDILGTRIDDMNYEYQEEEYNDYPKSNGLANSFDNPDYNYYSAPKNDIEKDEIYYFNRTFDNETMSQRKKRIKSIKKAQRQASGYDNNKFQQGLSTAMQVGAFILMILAIVL